MMYQYNIKIAAKFFLQSIRYLKSPPNYWMTLESKLLFREGQFKESDRILDIGSYKPLALYLSKVIGSEVFTTDIDDYFIKSLDFLRQFEIVSPTRLHLKIEDGRKLSFDNDYFNKIYSLSVLQGIPNEGDIECIKEMARVLRKGGKCIITIPFSPISKIEYRDEKDLYWAKHSIKNEEGNVFFSRRYSEQELYERIINPSGLTLEKLQFIGEKILTNSEKEFIDILPRWTLPIQPLLSMAFLTKPHKSSKSLKKPLCAFIVLKK